MCPREKGFVLWSHCQNLLDDPRNKKKIQMIFVEYGFNFTREVKNMYISFVASPLMKYKYFSLHWMK